jgi:hypothetical protein
MTRLRGDQGRVSVFVAITFVALLAALGLGVDAPGRFRTMLHADSLAAEAARAAGQAIDVDHTAAQGVHRVSPTAARAAAESYLTQAGVEQGQVTFNDDLTQVTVTVDIVYEPRILGLFGFPATTVTGTHTAALVPG